MVLDTLTIIIIAAISLIAILIGCRYYFREIANPAGKNAHRKTTGILKRFALLRDFKTIAGAEVGDRQVENMLIGFFGILLVRTLGEKGDYYGTLHSEMWAVERDFKRRSFPNPIKQLEQDEAAIRAVFGKEKIYSVPITGVVYLTSASKKTQIYITHNGEILPAGKLAGYLNKTKFEKDAGVDVDKIYSVLAK